MKSEVHSSLWKNLKKLVKIWRKVIKKKMIAKKVAQSPMSALTTRPTYWLWFTWTGLQRVTCGSVTDGQLDRHQGRQSQAVTNTGTYSEVVRGHQHHDASDRRQLFSPDPEHNARPPSTPRHCVSWPRLRCFLLSLLALEYLLRSSPSPYPSCH